MTGNGDKSPLEGYPTDGPVRRFTDGTEPIFETLGDLRRGVDWIDSTLGVPYLALRAAAVVDGARFKANPNYLTAPERERQVIQGMVSMAVILNPAAGPLVKRSMETVVAASKDAQRLQIVRHSELE